MSRSKGRVPPRRAPRGRKSGPGSPGSANSAWIVRNRSSRIADIQKKMERLHQTKFGRQPGRPGQYRAIIAFSPTCCCCFRSSPASCLAGLVLFLMHRMISSWNQRSSDHLYAALEGMPQGLSMFDDKRSLIACNAKYGEMYGLARRTRPAGHLAANHSGAPGRQWNIAVDAEDFVEEGLALECQPAAVEQQLQDGRIISLLKAPLNTGGAVTIHMDVTREAKFGKADRIPGASRCADGTGQSRPAARAYRTHAGRSEARRPGIGALCGSRPLQDRQRHAGTLDRG